MFPFNLILPTTPKREPHPDIGLFPRLVAVDPAKAEAEERNLEALYQHCADIEKDWEQMIAELTHPQTSTSQDLLNLFQELDNPSINTPSIATEITIPAEEVVAIDDESKEEQDTEELPPPLPNQPTLHELIRKYILETERVKPNFGTTLFPEYAHQKRFIDIMYSLTGEPEDKEISVTDTQTLLNLFNRGTEYQHAGLQIAQAMISKGHPTAANRILETLLFCNNPNQDIYQNVKLNLIINGSLESKYAENILRSMIDEDLSFTTTFNEEIFESCLKQYLSENQDSSSAHFLLAQYYLKQAKKTDDAALTQKAASHFLESIEKDKDLLEPLRYSVDENKCYSIFFEHARQLQQNKKIEETNPIYSLVIKIDGGNTSLLKQLQTQAETTQEGTDWYVLANWLMQDLAQVKGKDYHRTEFTKWSFYKALETKDYDLMHLATNLGNKLFETGAYNLAELVFYELVKADPTNEHAKENLSKAKELNQQ